MFSCFRPREADASAEKQLDLNDERDLKEKLKAATREAKDAQLTIETLHVALSERHEQLEDLQEQLRQSKEQASSAQQSRALPASPSSEISEVRQDEETATFDTPMHTPLSQTPAGTPARPGSVPPGPTKQQLDQIEHTLNQIQKAAMEKQQALEAEALKAQALIDQLTIERDDARNELQASIESTKATFAISRSAQEKLQEELGAKVEGLRSKLEEKETEVNTLKIKVQELAHQEPKEERVVLQMAISEVPQPPPEPSIDPLAALAAEEKAGAAAMALSQLTAEHEALKASHAADILKLQASLSLLEAENSQLSSKNSELDLACAQLNAKVAEMVSKHDELDAVHADLVVKHSLLESTRDEEVLDVQASHAALKGMYDDQHSRLREIEPELLEVKIAHEELTTQHHELKAAFEEANRKLTASEEERAKVDSQLKQAIVEAQKRTEELQEASRVALAASSVGATASLESHSAREELKAATTRYEAEKKDLEADLKSTRALLEASALREKLLVTEVAELRSRVDSGDRLHEDSNLFASKLYEENQKLSQKLAAQAQEMAHKEEMLELLQSQLNLLAEADADLERLMLNIGKGGRESSDHVYPAVHI